MKETIQQLQQVAKENGFYLCPEIVWNEMANTMEYKNSEIKRVKLGRDNWKKKYKILKEHIITPDGQQIKKDVENLSEKHLETRSTTGEETTRENMPEVVDNQSADTNSKKGWGKPYGY